MPIGLPEFIPGGDAGDIARIAIAGRPVTDSGPSVMERAARLRMDKERHQQQMADNKLFQPIKEAKAKADLAEANAHLDAVATTEQTRGKIADVLPAARREFDDLITLADPDARETAAFSWMGKYGQLENIAAIAPEWQSKKSILGKMVQESMGIRQREEQTRQQKELIGASGETAVAVADTKADSAARVAEARSVKPVERYRQKMIEAENAGETETAAFYRDLVAKETAIPVSTAAGSAQFQRQLADVEANGTDEEKAWWHERSKALNRRGVKQDSASKQQALLDRFTSPPSTQPASATPSRLPVSALPNPGEWQEIKLPSGEVVKIRRKG